MFRTFPLSVIRSVSLYTQQWYMSHRFADSLRSAGSGRNCSSVLILLIASCMTYTIAVCTVKRNCPKHVDFYSKNKFEKLVHLVGFIVRLEMQLLWMKFNVGRCSKYVQQCVKPALCTDAVKCLHLVAVSKCYRKSGYVNPCTGHSATCSAA